MEKELQNAYEMGKDNAINGSNETNCDFRIFSSPEKTKEWERGRDEILPPNPNQPLSIKGNQ